MDPRVLAPRKIWKVAPADEAAVSRLASALGVSRIVARVLVLRGHADPETAEKFLHADMACMHDPFEFRDMEKAVGRLLEAREKGERILIHGDYDVDGLASAALLMNGFAELGLEADFFLPHRLLDGYGLQEEKCRALQQEGYGLLVTVDCGITACDIVRDTQECGIDVILTDHHHPPPELPCPLALINPHVKGETYPFTGLCGAGVAWKLLQGLVMRAEDLDSDEAIARFEHVLDCVALGTIADVVPLVEENRGLVKLGLNAIRDSARPGMLALMETAGLTTQQANAHDIAFRLAPRLNALGRMGEAREAVELLTTRNYSTAQAIAQKMEVVNADRRRIQEEMAESAETLLFERPNFQDETFILLASPEWHRGILGIVASRIQERFHRPTALLAIEEGMAYGSARSISGYSMIGALESAGDLFEAFGGHEGAAGFRLPEDRIDALRERLIAHAREHLTEQDLQPCLSVDALVDIGEVSELLIQELELLEPYGCGNPRPVLAARGLRADDAPRIVGNNHLKMSVRQNAHRIEAIAFRMGQYLETVLTTPVDLAFRPSINEYQGRRTVQLSVIDMQEAERNGRGPVAPGPSAGRAAGNGTIEWHDSRCAAEKSKVIFDALEDGRRGLFLCESPEGRRQLVRTLGGTRIESTLDLHGELAEIVRDDGGLLVRMNTGKGTPGEEVPLGHVFFFDLPPGPKKPKRILEALEALPLSVEVHLLFGEQDKPAARRMIDSILPDRATLGRIYQILKEMARDEEVGLEELADRLESEKIDPAGLDRGLKVFDELFLIKRLPDKEALSLVATTGKRELSDSAMFRKIQEQREKLAQFQDALLSAPVEKVRALLGMSG